MPITKLVSTEAPSGGGARHFSYLAANFIRAFGPQGWHDKWAQLTVAVDGLASEAVARRVAALLGAA